MNNKLTIVLAVQLISFFGTHMADFALSLHLYEQSKSLFFYAYFSLFIILPEIVFAPFLAHYIDKYNKKNMILIGHAGSGFFSVVVLFMLYNEYNNLYAYLACIIISSVFGSIVLASINVLIGESIIKKNMQKFVSILQLGLSTVFIISPAIAAYLLDNNSIVNVFIIDIATFSFALIVIFFTSMTHNTKKVNTKLFDGVKEGIAYIKNNSILTSSLLLLMLIQFSMGQISVLITPIILSVASIGVLGLIMSITGVGMLIGTIIGMSIRINKNLLWFNIITILQSLVIFLCIFNLSVIAITIIIFIFMVCQTIGGILSYTYWQNNTDNDIKARVFSIRNSAIISALLVGYVTSAPLVEIVMKGILDFYPSISNIIGSHTYPEARLMFIVNATIVIIGTISLMVKQKKHNYE